MKKIALLLILVSSAVYGQRVAPDKGFVKFEQYYQGPYDWEIRYVLHQTLDEDQRLINQYTDEAYLSYPLYAPNRLKYDDSAHFFYNGLGQVDSINFYRSFFNPDPDVGMTMARVRQERFTYENRRLAHQEMARFHMLTLEPYAIDSSISFSYNSDHQVSYRVDSSDAYQNILYHRHYTYDDQKRLQLTSAYASDTLDSMFYRSESIIDYKGGNKEMKRTLYYASNGEVASEYHTRFFYNEEEQLERKDYYRLYDGTPRFIVRTEITYTGDLIDSIIITKDEQNDGAFLKQEAFGYEYDAYGRVILERHQRFNFDGTRRYRNVYTYPEFPNGIEDETASDDLKCFPNPAQHRLTVSSAKPFRRLEVYDVTGRKQGTYARNESDRATIDVQNLQPGVYFVRCDFEDGSDYKTVSFVKQ